MQNKMPEDEIIQVIALFGQEIFTTLDFIESFRKEYPLTWSKIVDEYGLGGKGAGTHYSAYSHVAQNLHGFTKKGLLVKHDYVHAPSSWGSSVIRRWSIPDGTGVHLFPDEVDEDDEIWEGAVYQVFVNKYERNSDARRKCISHYGYVCQVCDFDFEGRYGEIGVKFIHVHHLVPISEIGEKYKIDPIKDLVPVCPNCHAMLHHKNDVLSIEELRSLLVKSL